MLSSFTLSLFAAVVCAQSSPTITAPATLPTSVEGDEPVSCTNHLIQYCPRSGFPYFADGAVQAPEEINPYKLPYYGNFTSGETDASYSCQSKWYTAYDNYYNYTAEITAGAVVPAETLESGYTSTGTFTSWATRYTSAGQEWESYTSEEVVTDGQGGETTATKTYVGTNGVQTVTTATLDLSIISFQDVSNSPTYVPWTTVTNPSESREVIAAHTPYTYVKNFEYTAVRGEGCCQKCSLFGNSVQVLYWPTPAPTGAPKTLVNSNNFTFVYPTYYLALQSLYATDLCGTLDPQVVHQTTIAIPEEALSTAIAYRYNSTQYSANPPNIFPLYTKADFQNQQTTKCEDITTTAWIAGYSPGFDSTSISGDSLYTLTYNPCSPTLSVPTELFTINSAWTSCIPGINGLYDPPYSLTAGSGLAPFNPGPTTTSTLSTVPADPVVTPTPTTTPPSTGPTVAPPTPTPTTSPEDPTTSPPPVDDPSTDPATDPATKPNPPVQTPDPSTKVPDPPAQTPDPPVQDPNPPVETSPQNTPAVPTTPGQAPPVVDPTSPNPAQPADPGQTDPGQADPGQADPGQADPGQADPGQADPGQADPGQTLPGTVVSLDPSNTAIVVGGGNPTNVPATNPAPTAAPSFIIGSQTLAPGGPAVTVSGTVISLPSGGASIVIDGSTQNAGQFFSSEAAPEFVVGTSQTLKEGASAIVVQGTSVSLVAGGESVVVGGSSTIPVSEFLGASPTETQDGLGGVIETLGGFVPSPSNGGSNNTFVPANAGSRNKGSSVWVCAALLGGGFVGVWWL